MLQPSVAFAEGYRSEAAPKRGLTSEGAAIARRASTKPPGLARYAMPQAVSWSTLAMLLRPFSVSARRARFAADGFLA